MRKNTTILLICTVLLCDTAIVQDIESLLGVLPCEINVISIKKSNAPFINIRIPTLSKELTLFYPDLEVFISKETNRIDGVGSKREYQSKIGV